MEKNMEQVQMEFNTQASGIFFNLYEKFESEAGIINRKKDNNVFQMMEGKYLYTLRLRLENLAKSLIEKYHATGNIVSLQKMLMGRIKDLTSEFSAKAESL